MVWILLKKEKLLLTEKKKGIYFWTSETENILIKWKYNVRIFKIVQKYEDRFIHAKEITTLPKEPDWEAINDFISSVNEDIVCWQIQKDTKNFDRLLGS